jgi:predicted ATPase
MRVYFSGAHSSGKSTLARYASQQYKLPLLPEVARTILSEQELQIDTLRSDIDVADKYQTDVFYRQMQEEKKYDNFVADRSAIDCLTYSFQHTRVGHKLISDPMFKDYLEAFKHQKPIVFFVRPSHATLKSDGVRESLSWDGVVAIDAMLKLLLELFEIKYFHINTDNMQERIKIVNNIIG